MPPPWPSCPTPKLTRALIAAVQKQSPPRAGVSRPKLRYAHQGGMNPPLIMIHGNGLEHVPDSYRRYLERLFMAAFKLRGTPVKVFFKQGRNPFADRRKALIGSRGISTGWYCALKSSTVNAGRKIE